MTTCSPLAARRRSFERLVFGLVDCVVCHRSPLAPLAHVYTANRVTHHEPGNRVRVAVRTQGNLAGRQGVRGLSTRIPGPRTRGRPKVLTSTLPTYRQVRSCTILRRCSGASAI